MCFHCGSSITKKNGIRSGKQKYKCYACGKQFLGGIRIFPEELWKAYTEGKQTYYQLAEQYQCSTRTIQRKLDLHKVVLPEKAYRDVVVLMDSTYWGRLFGVMLFKDGITKENLLKYYIKYETNAKYIEGIGTLKAKGYNIKP